MSEPSKIELGQSEKGRPELWIKKIKQGEGGKGRKVAEGEPMTAEVDQTERKTKDPITRFARIEREIDELESGAEKGEVLTEKEVHGIRELISDLPQKNKEYGWELGRYTGEMIVEASKKDSTSSVSVWRELSDSSTGEVRRKQLKKDNPNVGFIYDYINKFKGEGVETSEIKWEDVLALGVAIQSIENNIAVPEAVFKVLSKRATPAQQDKALAKMKAKEASNRWENKETKLRAYENMLGMHQKELQIDVGGFFEKKLLMAIETRLDAMRGEYDWTTTDPDDENKLIWALELYKNNKGFSQGLKVSLLAEDEYKNYFSGNGEIAQFLTKMERRDYWEGKRKLDRACYAKALGFVEGDTNDIYAELTKDKIQVSGIDALAGPEAVGQWTIDKNFTKAFDLLFACVELVYDPVKREYYYDVPSLKKQIEDARSQGIPNRAIEDAIKANLVFATDMVKNAPAKNRLYTNQRFVEYYKWAKVVDEFGKTFDLFGEGFGLTDSLTGKMGRFSPRNMVIDYAADSIDRRRLDLEKNPDQRDELWKSVFWYQGVGMRGIYGARNDPKEPKTTIIGNPAVDFHPEDIVLPGNTSDYLDFNNNYTRDIGETDSRGDPVRTFIHRRALYKCLNNVVKEHEDLIAKGAPGKPGLDHDFGLGINLIDEIKNVLNAPEFNIKKEINIETTNPQLQKALQLVLRNPYSWGIMFSFNDWETVDRMRRGYTIRRALEYEHKVAGTVGAFRTELGIYPDRLAEHLGITSSAVKAVFAKAMGSRYAWSQLTRQATPLYEFADMATWKVLAKSMPGQEQVEEAYSEAGRGLGYNTSEEYVRMLLNVKGKYTTERDNYLKSRDAYVSDQFGPRTYLGQSVLVNSMFIWQETDKRLSMIENGDQESADAASMAFILKERDTRAFTWQRARQVLWQARGFFWNRVGALAKTGVEGHPAQMEQWRQLDLTWEMSGGRLVGEAPTLEEVNNKDGRIHTIAIQDITDAEMSLYFNVIEPGSADFARVGNIYKQLNISKSFPPPEPYQLSSETKILVFKNLELRREFYMNRTTEVLNLFYGREGSYKITLPKKLYTKDGNTKVGEGELIRQASEIYEFAFSVERVNAYIEAEKIYISSILDGKGLVETSEAVEKMFRTFQANEQLREVDIERIENALGGYTKFLGNIQRGRYKAFHWLFHKKLAEIPIISSLTGIPFIGGLIKDFSAADVLGTALAMGVVIPIASTFHIAASVKTLEGFSMTQLSKIITNPIFGEALASTLAGPAGWLLWFFESTVMGKILASGANLLTGKIFPAAPRAVPQHLYDIKETPFKPKN